MKKSILSLLLFLGVLSASAQAEPKGTTEYVFNPHWYVMIQPLGAQYTLGEDKFGNLLSYNVQAAVGVNFSKYFGARLSVNAWQSKGAIELCDQDIKNEADFCYKGKFKWNYVQPSLELTANITNMFCYNPERCFNLYLLAGAGANIGFSNKDAERVSNEVNNYWARVQSTNNIPDRSENMDYLWTGTKTRFVGKFGLLFDFRVSERVSFNIEGNANLLTDKYNSKKAGNSDWYFNALAGVKINLGKTHSKKFTPAPEPEIRYVEKVVEKIVKEPCPETNTVVVKEPFRRDVFFKIRSWKISKEEGKKVEEIANYMKQNPNAKLILTGYADAGTGNNKINDRLADKRSKAVMDVLTKKYGIDTARINHDSKGSRVQMFKENDKNRVTICIAE